VIPEAKYILPLTGAAFLASTALTATVRKWAIAHDFVDQPGHRKIHTQPIALGGGIAIVWVTLLPCLIALAIAWYAGRRPLPDWMPMVLSQHIPGMLSRGRWMLALCVAAAALHILGLIDDRRRLGPWSKLLVQLGAATMLALWGGIRFDFFIPNVWITTLLSVLWMTVIINAFNFLDNMDGLSAGIAAICASVILVAALQSGQVFVSAFLALFAGALLGFLVFNFAPAKIFMGDAGSLVVGLFLAVASVRTTYYHQDQPSGSWVAALMPLVILAVPLYDFTSVVLLRLLQGKSPFVGDTQHFSHRLVQRGMSKRQAVLTIYLATATTSLGAMILPGLSNIGAALVFAQTILILLIIAILENPGKNNGGCA